MADEPTTKFDPPVSAQFTALTEQNRRDIVALSSTSLEGAALVNVNSLELTALGANVDLFANWNSKKSDLAAWIEQGYGGRVTKSVTVRRGYLFPLGHQAVIIETSLRTIGVDPVTSGEPGNYPIAYLQQTAVVQVTEAVKTYPAVGQPFAFDSAGGVTTDWPFQSARMTTLTVSDISVTDIDYMISGDYQALWLTTGSGKARADVQWSFVVTDAAGHDVAMTMPLGFVYGYDEYGRNGASSHPSSFSSEYSSWTANVVTAYLDDEHHQKYAGAGGNVLWAPEIPGDTAAAGQTTHPSLLIELGASTTAVDRNAASTPFPPVASTSTLESSGQPNFYPTIRRARIRVHAADTLTGSAFDDKRPSDDPLPNVGGVQFKYYPDYVSYGQTSYLGATERALGEGADGDNSSKPPNAGAVFAQFENPAALNLPAANAGGVGTPNADLVGLSGKTGAVGGDIDSFAQSGKVPLASYFPATAAAKDVASGATAAVAQLLGGLTLNDILDEDSFQAPTIQSTVDPNSGIATVTYTMVTPLGEYDVPKTGAALFLPDVDPDATLSPDGHGNLSVTANFIVPAAVNGVSQPPTYTVTGAIDPFTIYLIGEDSTFDFIHLHFASVSFTVTDGGSPNVVVNLDQVAFDGVLTFVNGLEQFIQNLGGGGLTISVTPSQVTLGTSITLPDIAFGIFTLSGLGFAANVTIPLIDGTAVASFSFATQANPFTLTVACFGGGGYIGMGLGFGGVHSMQMQFEFTGQFAFDIVVANRSLSLVAGIYISYSPPVAGDDTSGLVLTGFVRVTGQLQVLGLITISAEINLSLTYDSEVGAVTGTATLMASVSICGFTKTVGITMTKTFGGGSSVSTTSSDAMRLAGGLGSDRGPEEIGRSDSTPPVTFADLFTQGDWNNYCAAYGGDTSGL